MSINFSGKNGEGKNKNSRSTIGLQTINVQRHKDMQELIKAFAFQSSQALFPKTREYIINLNLVL